MKIWMINQYNMPPEYGHLNRQFNFAKYLHEMGHEPTVFVGSFLHNTTIQVIKDKSKFNKYSGSSFSYYFIKTCDYSMSRFKRVIAMFEFYKNLFFTVKDFERPDVIIGSSAHPLAALAAINLAKKFDCMSIVEVRDLWPESFVAYGIMGRSNPILKILYAMERRLYKKADKIIFTMEGGKDYINERKWDVIHGGDIDINKVHHVNNGVDLKEFNYNKRVFQFQDEDLDNPESFKVVYVGSIRLVNNVKSIVDAAFEIKKMGANSIKFIIYGEGDEREQLEEYCKANMINNVIFKGLIEKKFIPYVLSKSDLNILHFEESKIKRYGPSLNKMFEYFASGKPILSDCRFNYDLIEKYDCGVVIDNATAKEVAEEIISIREMETEKYNRLCNNALIAAEEYDFEKLTKKLINVIEEGDK